MFGKIKEKIKNTNMIYDYGQMWPFVKPYWGRALLAILLTLPVGAMDAAIAWVLKPYMDVMMIEKNTSTLWIPLLIIAFSMAQGILTFAANFANTWVGSRISSDVKIALFEKLMKFDATFFDTTTSGTVMMRFNNDVDAACSGLLSNIKQFSTRFFSSVALIMVLFYNSWHLALIAVVILFCALFPLTRVRKRIKDINKKTVFTSAEVVTHYNESFCGNRIISSYNLYDYQNKRFDGTLRNVFKLGMKMVQRTGMLSPLMHFVVSLGIALVIWVGSYLIVHHQITAGNFVSFVAALILLYNPIKGIGNNFNNVQVALMAMERVFELLQRQPDIADRAEAKELEQITKGISYRNVNFEYVAGKPVLKNINLEIKKGQTIALVGNSGGGKTTLVNLLPRFYDVTSGQILIDGTDIRDLTLYSLRDKIAVVFQDNFLFSGTIRDNILLGNAHAGEEEIEAAVSCACLTDFIKDLPQGLDTQIGERGVLLSGGQKQRIAIARAFIKNAPIVILDEATSALDNKSEAIVQQAIDNLMADRTVFVIAHRLSTVRNADKIVVVNYGEIVETGTHNELISKPDSIYASLYQAQLA
ncbi:MAG: ABC transporter transmembrane domain-containing protein [Pseudomonadota bacterium]|nr:ABC transporter transmembrane domain-containing protein [Pseudomonadota bacterium]